MRLFFFILLLMALGLQGAEGLIRLQSSHTAGVTADRLEAAIKARGLTLFNRIDHRANASAAGLDMNPSVLFIFGNPRLGTPLMKCAPTMAIDLPQKILIRRGADGTVWLSYNDPFALARRHDMRDCRALLKKIAAALNGLAREATGEQP